jgi:hypothetical protein
MGDSLLPVDVKLFDDLDDVERDAAGDLDRAAQPSLFDRLSWFRLTAKHCPPPGKLLVARAQTEEQRLGRTKAWLFLVVETGHARILASWYSLRAGLIHSHPDQAGTPDCIEAIANALRRDRSIDRITLYPLIAGVAAQVEGFRRAGWIARAEPAGISWQVDTDGDDFTAYWAKRPSRLRNTAQRKAKAAGLDVVIHRRFDEAAWADYESVYQASWKPEEGSPAFLRALAEQEGEAGTLRLGIAGKDGTPLAAQLWLVENGEATIHKLAYREDAKELSPGTVLSMAMFRSALDKDRVRRIDYGTGDDGYKRDWMEERVPLLRMTAFDPRTVKGLAGAARASASALVARLRSR